MSHFRIHRLGQNIVDSVISTRMDTCNCGGINISYIYIYIVTAWISWHGFTKLKLGIYIFLVLLKNKSTYVCHVKHSETHIILNYKKHKWFQNCFYTFCLVSLHFFFKLNKHSLEIPRVHNFCKLDYFSKKIYTVVVHFLLEARNGAWADLAYFPLGGVQSKNTHRLSDATPPASRFYSQPFHLFRYCCCTYRYV